MNPGAPDPAVWLDLLGRPGSGAPLPFPAQAAFFDACWSAAWEAGPWGPRGVVGALGCGHGKTLCAQLAPVLLGSVRPLLLLPAAMVPATARYVAEWSRWYPCADPPTLTYELLSQPHAARVLETHAPDLLVLDECHLLGNPTSARWRRVARYVQAHPSCRVVLLSGTLAWAEIGTMSHLLHASVRDRSPLPVWAVPYLARVLDVGGVPAGDDHEVAARVLGPHAPMKDDARRALHDVLRSTPGVVLAAGVAADVSLYLDPGDGGYRQPPAIEAALGTLRARWDLPDGTQLVDALEHHRHARSLALGWYGRWVPGTVDPEWLAARRTWASETRRILSWSAWSGELDSPAQVAAHAQAGRLDGPAQAAWYTWAEAPRHHPGTPADLAPDVTTYREWDEPPTEVVWLDGAEGALAGVVEAWARTLGDEVGVVWYASRAVEGALRQAGLPIHGAGSAPPTGGLAAASWRVHGTGWNGQTYHRALVLELPESAGQWEQVLARLHRPGQTRDVRVDLHVPTDEVRAGLHAALAGARFAASTLGAPQRLHLASWLRPA